MLTKNQWRLIAGGVLFAGMIGSCAVRTPTDKAADVQRHKDYVSWQARQDELNNKPELDSYHLRKALDH